MQQGGTDPWQQTLPHAAPRASPAIGKETLSPKQVSGLHMIILLTPGCHRKNHTSATALFPKTENARRLSGVGGGGYQRGGRHSRRQTTLK